MEELPPDVQGRLRTLAGVADVSGTAVRFARDVPRSTFERLLSVLGVRGIPFAYKDDPSEESGVLCFNRGGAGGWRHFIYGHCHSGGAYAVPDATAAGHLYTRVARGLVSELDFSSRLLIKVPADAPPEDSARYVDGLKPFT